MSGDERVNQVLRISPQLRACLKDSARAHGVSVNWLAEKALTDFLSRLLSPEEVRWTRPLATPLLREDQP